MSIGIEEKRAQGRERTRRFRERQEVLRKVADYDEDLLEYKEGGLSLADIAQAHGVSRQAVHKAFLHRGYHPEYRQYHKIAHDLLLQQGLKACNCCGLVKPLDDFSKGNDGKSGRAHWCRICMAQKLRSYNEKRKALGYKQKWIKPEEVNDMVHVVEVQCLICGVNVEHYAEHIRENHKQIEFNYKRSPTGHSTYMCKLCGLYANGVKGMVNEHYRFKHPERLNVAFVGGDTPLDVSSDMLTVEDIFDNIAKMIVELKQLRQEKIQWLNDKGIFENKIRQLEGERDELNKRRCGWLARLLDLRNMFT